MRRLILTLSACFIVSGLLYGLGLPPFRKTAALDQQPARERVRPLTVEVGEVRRGSVEENISAVGSLMARRTVEIAPKIGGRIERILVQVGDRVRQGQLVAQLDSRELEEELREAQASLRVAEANLKGEQAELLDLKRKVERTKQLFEKRFVSRQELDTLNSESSAAAAQVELARAQIVQMRSRLANAKLKLSEVQLTAPFAGYIDRRRVDPGAMVNVGTPIASLVDIGRVKVIIPVVERDYPRISIGQGVGVTCDAYPGRRFAGKVARLAPVLNEATRTGEVEIEVDNSSGQLKPGMFARVEIAIDRRHDVLLVPEGALIKTPSGHGVYRIVDGEAKNPSVKLVAVQAGASRAGETEIRGALKTGERIVTLGANLLKDGQRVSIAGARDKGGRRES